MSWLSIFQRIFGKKKVFIKLSSYIKTPIDKSRYDAEKEKLESQMSLYDRIGDEKATKMREHFAAASSAYASKNGAEAKRLSLIGHDYEGQAGEANDKRAQLYWRLMALNSKYYLGKLGRSIKNIDSNTKTVFTDIMDDGVTLKSRK